MKVSSFAGGGGSGLVLGRPATLRRRLQAAAGALINGVIISGQELRAAKEFASRAMTEPDAVVYASAACVNLGDRSDIRIARGFVCRGVLRRESFGGRITIGRNVYIGDHSLVSCGDEVTIGDDVIVSFGVVIVDNDAHPLDSDAGRRHLADIIAKRRSPEEGGIPRAPVRIGNGAWLGFGASVMKGVAIGEAAVVAAGAVVVTDVAPYAVVAGNPARQVGSVGGSHVA